MQNSDQDATRIYDPDTKTLTISNRISSETARFQILLQLALISKEKLLEATLDLARFKPQKNTNRQNRFGQLFRGCSPDAL